MKTTIEFPDFIPEKGIHYKWIGDSYINISLEDEDTVVIKANKDGLLSLANHLLNLSQDSVPKYYHMHFDDINGGVEDGSLGIIIEKIPTNHEVILGDQGTEPSPATKTG